VTHDRRRHHVLWHCGLLASCEYASLTPGPQGYQLESVAVLTREGLPCHIEYAVVVDTMWLPRAAHVTITVPGRARRIELARDVEDRWTIDGSVAPLLDGCSDIDLGWTPATNTVPIRRLHLEIGATATVSAAWIRFPELDIVADEQHYTRLADDRWRYRSGDYDFELVTQPDSGLVLAYGDDLWRAAATSTSSD